MEEGNKDSMTKARWLNHRGVIASFLRTLPKLNSISIGFVPRHTRCAYPESFYNIVSLGSSGTNYGMCDSSGSKAKGRRYSSSLPRTKTRFGLSNYARPD